MRRGAIITGAAPLPLAPVAADKPWGVVRRSAFNAPSKADGLRWGVIWLAAEEFGLTSKISSGPRAGLTLAAVKAEWGQILTGPENPLRADARKALGASFRLERTGDEPGPVRVLSEDEFWYVAEAGPDSWLGIGASPESGDWRRRLAKSTLESGDLYLMPRGLVHCQGPSAVVLKALPAGSLVQTLHDWDRPPDPWDFSPPPRPLPVISSAKPILAEAGGDRDRVLYKGPLYAASLVKTGFFTSTGQRMSLLCPLKGRGHVETSGVKETARLQPGQAVVLPAGLGRYSVKSGTAVTYLLFEFE